MVIRIGTPLLVNDIARLSWQHDGSPLTAKSSQGL